MVKRPSHLAAFEFAVLSSLRAVQLLRGCTPRVEGVHKRVVIAQLEVASGHIVRSDSISDPLKIS
jgi:DNA-directed RNA polymerase subunit K/omega